MTSQVHPTSPSERRVILAIGGNQPSNKGNSAETVRWALTDLSNRVGAPIRKSRLFRTPAFPKGAGPDFVNAAVCFEGRHLAQDILDLCHAIEEEAARIRQTRWAPRTLDLDVIAVGDLVLPDAPTFAAWRDLPLAAQTAQTPDQLILPHPRLQDRAFVLVPMLDICADWCHPVSGLSVPQMLDLLPEAEKAAVCQLNQA